MRPHQTALNYVMWMCARFFPCLLVIWSSPVRAQEAVPIRAELAVTALGVNAAVGAILAASTAWLGKRDVRRAAIQGATGGALVAVGKTLGPTRGAVTSWSGVGITALGSSVVSNAACGRSAFSEVLLPVGPFRVRVLSDGHFSPSASINAYETIVLANRMHRRGLRFDWSRTLRTGAIHFWAERQPLIHGIPGTADGVTEGGIVVLSKSAVDLNRTQTHEMIHVKQQWVWSQNFTHPIESAVRQHWGIFRLIPSWIDPGVAFAALYFLEGELAGRRRGPLYRLQEREAELYVRLREP